MLRIYYREKRGILITHWFWRVFVIPANFKKKYCVNVRIYRRMNYSLQVLFINMCLFLA